MQFPCPYSRSMAGNNTGTGGYQGSEMSWGSLCWTYSIFVCGSAVRGRIEVGGWGTAISNWILCTRCTGIGGVFLISDLSLLFSSFLLGPVGIHIYISLRLCPPPPSFPEHCPAGPKIYHCGRNFQSIMHHYQYRYITIMYLYSILTHAATVGSRSTLLQNKSRGM